MALFCAAALEPNIAPLPCNPRHAARATPPCIGRAFMTTRDAQDQGRAVVIALPRVAEQIS